jgi:hypothetical protein
MKDETLSEQLEAHEENRRMTKMLAKEHEWCDQRIADLEAALKGIAELSTLTLLGGRGMESDRAYEAGANSAFGQAAEMARSALTKDSK